MWDMGDWRPEEVRRVGRRRIFLWRLQPLQDIVPSATPQK
jgi:hypothetical protein